jgi:hypothetical protein
VVTCASNQGRPCANWVVVPGMQVVYRIGRTMFETASLPQHLVQHCNAMDEVWVPSEFNKETFISAGILDCVASVMNISCKPQTKHPPVQICKPLWLLSASTGT